VQTTLEKNTTLPAQAGDRNVFAVYGESAGGGYIAGELLKFSKGDWLAGQENREIADGTKLVAAMDTLVVGWQRWENQRPVSYRMGLLVEGFVPPPREELGDNDETLWEQDDTGEPRDPWQLTNYLQLVDPKNPDTVFTFTTASKGGLGAVAKLCREYGRAREKEGRDGQYPIIMLSTGSYAHRDRSLGRIKYPQLNIIGWVKKSDFAPVVDPIGDEVPFYHHRPRAAEAITDLGRSSFPRASLAMSTNLAVALELAAAGIPIFPAGVFQRGSTKWQKRPLIDEWQKSATTDREQIRQWWRRYPSAVPGIWCGHPDLNFIMLDPDRHGGPDGVEAFAQLICDEIGELPPHPTTQTAGGGYHHIFRQPDGTPIGNTPGNLPAGIDVRGQGGWFVAPGAVRRDGAAWRTLDGTPPLAQAFRDVAIPKLCDRLAAIIRTPKSGNGAATVNAEVPTNPTPPAPDIWQQQATARERAFAAAALDNLAAELTATAPGQRNRKLYDCTFRMATMIARRWIDRATVADALWQASERNGLATDDGADSVQATLASGFKDGTACPHPDLEDRDERPTADKPNADKPNAERVNANQSATLRMITADELEMRGIEWLWPGRFALGKIGLVAGLPDYGKGQIAAFLAAAVTAALELPCGEGTAPQGHVIWFNAEDDARDTVKPRLVAAGADLKRVHFVNGTHRDGVDKTFNLIADLPLLREAIKKIGNVALVIIDPVSAYLGIGKVDTRSQSDVRGVLTPLKELAEQTGAAVIGICHFNKKSDVTSALLRVSDSIAFTAAARSVYVALDDPEDGDNKIFVKAKNNLAADNKALRYGFGVKTVGHDTRLKKDIDAPYILWHAQHVELSANDVMQAAASGTAYAKKEARDFLLDRLDAGPASADDIIAEAEQNGIAKKTLYRAKRELGIKSRKERGKLDGGWTWELPSKTKMAHHTPSERE
jgi:hypothetical protein